MLRTYMIPKRLIWYLIEAFWLIAWEDIAKISNVQDGVRSLNAISWDFWVGQSGHCYEHFHKFPACYQFCSGHYLIALDYVWIVFVKLWLAFSQLNTSEWDHHYQLWLLLKDAGLLELFVKYQLAKLHRSLGTWDNNSKSLAFYKWVNHTFLVALWKIVITNILLTFDWNTKLLCLK